MSLTTKLILLAAFIFSMLLMSMNNRKKRKRIVFFGDSITEQGARAGGYIKRINQYLEQEGAEGIADKYELVGSGIGGNKVTDLEARLSRDVLSRGADVVVLFIGINDVWHKFSKMDGTDEQSFSVVYRGLIDNLLSAAIKVVLCTPTVIGEKQSGMNEADPDLDAYSDIIRNFAEEYSLPLVDLRNVFTSYLSINNTENLEQGMLTSDKVHLNERGNQLVADAMWTVLRDIK